MILHENIQNRQKLLKKQPERKNTGDEIERVVNTTFDGNIIIIILWMLYK